MPLYWALRLAFALSGRVPLRWRYRLGMRGCEAVYWCWRSKRRNTIRNMDVVFRAMGKPGRAAAAARASWRNYGRYVTDFLNLPHVPPAMVEARARIEGWEHLDAAMARGKGAIVVGGHVGLWDYAPGVVARRYPGHMYLLVEPFASPRVEGLIQGQRAAQGSSIIQMTDIRGIVRALRGNGIVAVLIDRPVEDDGVPVTFFGRPAMVPGGAARLASLTGAALIPCYFRRGIRGGYESKLYPPIEMSRTRDRAADVRRTTQQLLDILEGIIRERPEDWYMFRDFWGTTLTPSPSPGARERGEDALTPNPSPSRGEGKQPAPHPPAPSPSRGEGESPARGEGESPARGEGESPARGEGETPARNTVHVVSSPLSRAQGEGSGVRVPGVRV